MHAVVRCPSCSGLSRVPAEALGLSVACPLCDRPFVAVPERESASPARPKAVPVVPFVHPFRDEPHLDSGHDHGRRGPASALIGLALLPLGIPLFWTAALLLSGVETIFTYALPVAVGLGVSGVCLGVVFTADWSHPTRVKGILMLVLIGYAAAAFLFFVQKDWLETARKRFGNRAERWQQYEPEDRSFFVQVPGRAADDPAAEPLPGWKLRTVRCADPRQRSTDVYVIAFGPPADAAEKLADDDWFAAARKAVVLAAGSAEPSETPVVQQGHPGREFAVVLPDRVTNRTVRVYRVGRRAFYLAVDGTHLPPDAGDVRKFFGSFYLKPGQN
jgi:hypothetical protein